MPPALRLTDALRNIDVLRCIGDDRTVTGVEYDSRRVQPGSLFVAMRGETTDGNRYVRAAIDAGAMMRAAIPEFDLGSHGHEKSAFGLDVANLRNIFKDDRFFGEQGCSHCG